MEQVWSAVPPGPMATVRLLLTDRAPGAVGHAELLRVAEE